MFYEQIKSILGRSEFIRSFDLLTAKRKSGYLIYNLNNSLKALLVARSFQETGKNILLITADDRIAEEYEEDLDLLLGSGSSFFFPDYEILPYEERSPHYLIRAQRILSLSRAVSSQPAVYVLSLRSLLRLIAAPDIFKKNVIFLRKGEDYDPAVLVSNLVGMGYGNEFQVTRVGEFAKRGGIIDVFSPNSSKPVRLEFYGDQVNSIRIFSATTQLSTGEELDEVFLLPSREFSRHDIETGDQLWEKIHREGFYEGIEQDVSLLLPETAGFSEYFTAEDVLLFWDDFHFEKVELLSLMQEVTEFYQKARENDKRRILAAPTAVFGDDNYLKRILKKHFSCFLSSSYQEFPESGGRLECPFRHQNNLQGNLDALEKEFKNKIKQGYRIFLQSDNQSQSNRMRDLLPQFETDLDFTLGVLQQGFDLLDCRLSVYTDHEIFSRYRRRRRQQRFTRNDALIDYESMQPGDYVVHIDHGIGIFAGLINLVVDGNEVECLTLKYADNDTVYVPTYQLSLISRYIAEEGGLPVIHKLGGKRWQQSKSRARKQIELIAEDLVKLYAERKVRRGISFDPDSNWQREMEDSFIYEDTPDQSRAAAEIKEDMEQDAPMERLLCGDVGFGKTEVAIRAAFKAVLSGWQVVVLVPTTLLAEQHYLVFRERLAQYPIRIAMFSRFRSTSAIRKDLARVRSGDIDIAIGTHRLLSKDVSFHKLGLLIIDEEHRFGVRHKEKLRKLKANVDTLYMSATPIPRTMYMALSKLKELSLILTSPKARLPIRTVIVPYDQEIIRDAITREVARGGQVFFVHNRVQTINSLAMELRQLVPAIRFAVAHGQLPERELEKITLDFAHHQYDVMISTTIIESGIDIPNANTIIVNRADTFGLAQLYQIRGRVGRSNRRAYAYLIIPPRFNEEARKRLETLTEYESLGSGYQIAMRDLEIRGAGALLGTKQSGLINSIGFNYYSRLLDDAVKNLQGISTPGLNEESEVRLNRLQVESDFYFPADYVTDEKERLNIYRRLISFTREDQFLLLEKELTDRFGEIPTPARAALLYFYLYLLVKKARLESFKLKKGKAVIEFSPQRLPSRRVLGEIINRFPYPVELEGTGNLKISFTLASDQSPDRIELYQKSMEIIKYLTGYFTEES